MPKYIVEMKNILLGTVEIQAESKEEAEANAYDAMDDAVGLYSHDYGYFDLGDGITGKASYDEDDWAIDVVYEAKK